MKKRFKRQGTNNVITVHDDLLFALYSLKPETIYYKVINGIPYLVNSIKGKGYEIGLRVELKKEDLGDMEDNIEQEVPIISYEDTNINVSLLFGQYYKDLCFSNIEKYITNILLDKFIISEGNPIMTFLEMEYYYRGKITKNQRCLNPNVYKKYTETISNLSRKELFLHTTNSFRDKKYALRNINIYQPFLILKDAMLKGMNNIKFEYTFSGFGMVLKKSKRYSTILPISAYRISFNQLRIHLAGYSMARDVFIQFGHLDKNPFEYASELIYCPNILGLIEETNDIEYPRKPVKNILRLKRNMVTYVEGILPRIDGVDRIESDYTYNETEKFALKHEFDYDENDTLNNYEFGIKDLGQDVEVSITAYLSLFTPNVILSAKILN